jgi:hypothetical protein
VKRALLIIAALASGGASGCASDLTPAWEVIEPRVFGARLEVEGDPTRSRPAPGESFTLRQFLVLPRALEGKQDELYDLKLALCLGFTTPDGRLACVGEVDVPATVQPVSDTELRIGPLLVPPLETLIPEAAAGADAPPAGEEGLAKVNQVAVFGAVCVQGKVERVKKKSISEDPPSQLFRCTDNDKAEFPDPLTFTLSVFLDLGRPGDLNHNPNFPCAEGADSGACHDGVAVKGEENAPGPVALVRPEPKKNQDEPREVTTWPAFPADQTLPWKDCADVDALPQVRAKSGEHLIRVRFDAKDRERFEYDAEEFGKVVRKKEREELLISHAVSEFGGDLARHFSVLGRDVSDRSAEIEVAYVPPDQSKDKDAHIPAKGRLVRFYFAVRDQRAGVDFTTRELCLLPPK